MTLSIHVWQGQIPRGIEFVASISIRIAAYWRDTTNIAIRQKHDERAIPFSDFDFSTVPNLQPGAVFNPLKAGILSCRILHSCFEWAAKGTWPGRIEATAWDAIPWVEPYSLEVGTLYIVNSPPSRLTKETTLAPESKDSSDGIKSTSSTTSLGIPPLLENRWLQCWTSLFMKTLRFSPFERVRDRWIKVPGSEGTTITLHVPCDFPYVLQHPVDELDIVSYPSEEPEGMPELTFENLIRVMLEWITRVAQTQNGWRFPQVIVDTSTLSIQGQLSIKLAEQGTTATAK